MRGSKTSLSFTESRLSSDYWIGEALLQESCSQAKLVILLKGGALVPTEESKDIVMYILEEESGTLTYICTYVS